MNKIIIKETDRNILGVDIMLYTIIAVLGYIILETPEFANISAIEYAPALFYTFGFFGLVAYFVNRRPNDYEFLFFGLINVIVASYILVNAYYPNAGFILGGGVLVYSIANVLNKGYHVRILMKNRDINLYPKLSITILLALLGVLVVSNLYDNLSLQTMVLGYYFMTFGLLSLFEPLLKVVIKNPKLESYLVSLLEEEMPQKEDREEVKIKETKTSKPVVKVKEEVEDKKEVAGEKKNTKKKVVKKSSIKKTSK